VTTTGVPESVTVTRLATELRLVPVEPAAPPPTGIVTTTGVPESVTVTRLPTEMPLGPVGVGSTVTVEVDTLGPVPGVAAVRSLNGIVATNGEPEAGITVMTVFGLFGLPYPGEEGTAPPVGVNVTMIGDPEASVWLSVMVKGEVPSAGVETEVTRDA